MEENKMKSEKKGVLAMLLVLVAVVIGVKFIFAGMEAIMPKQWDAQVWEDMQTEQGTTALYDLRMVSEEELQEQDIQKWLTYAMENEEQEQSFWLNRQERGEYIFYLPAQDRVLKNKDISATEEIMDDGRVTLVIRARTPEDSAKISPEEQLFCMKSESAEWDGQRVKVILDGREQTVVRINGQGDRIYTADGSEIK